MSSEVVNQAGDSPAQAAGEDGTVDKGRRRLILATTSAVGAVGVGFAVVPFIKAWKPSAKARAVGAPVTANIGKLEPGQLLKVVWRGQTIGILKRSETMIGDLEEINGVLSDPDSSQSDQPGYAANTWRSLRPEVLVVNMHCTHLGCVPSLNGKDNPPPGGGQWVGGFYCPCHKSKFDLAGRVYAGVPAPTNLRIPPYRFSDDQTVVIGIDPEGAA